LNKFVLILSFFLIVLLLGNICCAQTITVHGQAYDKESKLPLPKLMIINKKTNNGLFADSEGKFTISMQQSDTLLLSAVGFKAKKITLKDSAYKKEYDIVIPLEKLYFILKEVSVFAPRSLNEIQKDIDKIGSKLYKKPQLMDYVSSGPNGGAAISPITYLYDRFSKFSKSKQKVAEWENEDLRRDVLKDLFRVYIKHDIIDLDEEEFDAFIKYLQLSDDFIINASQFELVMAIKGRYESFKYRWK
jgi:hypothetical protein